MRRIMFAIMCQKDYTNKQKGDCFEMLLKFKLPTIENVHKIIELNQ